MNMNLFRNVQYIKGVGPHRAKKLNNLNIYTIEDLLYYFPRDYQDRSNISTMKFLIPGKDVNIKGEVIKIWEEQVRKGLRVLRVSFTDGTDVINGVWFNQSYLKKNFKKGKLFILNGKLNEKSWQFGKKEINNPVFEELSEDDNIHVGRIVPIYSLTNGISQKQLRLYIYNALKNYSEFLKEILPEYIRKKYNLMDIKKSILNIHFPESRSEYIKARTRLAFEELFLLQVLVLKRKEGIKISKGIKHKSVSSIINSFLSSLNFNLTLAQENVLKEIEIDMEKDIPMQRLLQGDVGSGKTIIAVLALIKTIYSGFQGVFMAPTEILAEQHYIKLIELLSPLDINIVLLTGSLNKNKREEIEIGIKNKDYDLIIGTHALFQDDIEYNKLGLIVIDEQHRFGVEQRYKLKNKGDNPDLLVMTATPIPRSLALILYGDLDLSVIDELPPGRKKVISIWRNEDKRPQIYEFIKEKLREGRQAYIVCPAIEVSEEMKLVSAIELKKELENTFFKDFKLRLLHSKLESEEKKEIMNEMRKGNIDVLISTTIIEVGVDIPNASVMVIENADRFGLAQLHQLRGRIGRGSYKSYCIYISNPTTEDALKRLKVITSINDGFKISEEDLKLRGPGEFFGTRQHGLFDFKIASFIEDSKILDITKKEAEGIIKKKQWEEYYLELSKKITEIELKI
jgi:ATP-dependent DNA helicase RecG